MKQNKIKMILSLIILLLPIFVFAQSVAPNPTTAVAPTVPGLSDAPILNIVTNVMNWLLGILGLLGVIGFAVSGILYLTSAGNEEQIQKAKKSMTYSIIGIIVGLSGVLIIRAAETMLSGTSSTF